MKFIKRHRCHHIEISQLICRANQLTGFYMTVILAFNVLMYQVFINNFVTKKLKYRGSSEWLSYSQPNIRSMFSDSFRLSLENIDWKKKSQTLILSWLFSLVLVLHLGLWYLVKQVSSYVKVVYGGAIKLHSEIKCLFIVNWLLR